MPDEHDASARLTWWRRRSAGLPLGAWLGVAVVAVLAIVGTALAMRPADHPQLASDVTDLTDLATAAATPAATAPDTTMLSAPPVPDSAPRSSAAPTTAESVPATTEPRDPDGKTPERPLPAGDPAVSRFTYDDGFGATWSGTIIGVIETPLYWADDSDERCFVVLGTVTPEQVAGLVSQTWSAPYVTLFVGGDEVEPGDLPCDTAALAAAGYRSLYEAHATAGTEVPFYLEVSVPKSEGPPEVVAVGQGGDGWSFFDAALLPTAPPITVGPVGALPAAPVPVAAGSPGPFTHVDEYTGDEWAGTVAGLVEVPTDGSAERAGRCFAVVADLTATALGSGLTTSAYGAPAIGLIADGRLVDDHAGCDPKPAEAAGYRWYDDTEITAGTTLAVYATLLVPEPFPGELQAIVVGDPWGGAPTVLEPYVLGGFAPARAAPGPAPAGAYSPSGTALAIEHDYDDAAWDVVFHGYVRRGDCVVALAKATQTVGAPDQPAPEMFAVAGGRLLPEAFDCDTAAVTDAGYVSQWDPSPGVGAPMHVYAAFRIAPTLGPLQAIVIGRALLAEPIAVTPTELSDIPPIPR